jgi:RNA polymerase sigma factor for flagellar operon FliA
MATSPVSTADHSAFANNLFAEAWNTSKQKRPESAIARASTATATGTLTVVPKPAAAMSREQMLLETLPLVQYVARRIHERVPESVEFDDLVSAGVVGMIDAYNKFDAGKNVLFRTYAQVRIRGAILDSLRGLDWAPRELRRKARDMEEAKQRLMHRLGRRPLQSEVADELGMALAAYQKLLNTVRCLEIGSLQEPRSDDSLEEEVVYLEANPEDDPLHRCLQNERAAHLSAAVAELPKREQRVLQMYYVEEMTLKEIGTVLGLAESRISQIRAEAIQQLRSRFMGEEAEAESAEGRLIA